MNGTIRPRKLWYLDELKTVSVDQDFLASAPDSIVVLGDAGMGKSTLLEGLAEIEGYAACTARKLINARNPTALLGNATTLVIDALDEVAAQREGDAVDLVVQRLEDLGRPRFILSCRVADWQGAVSREVLSDLYGRPPLELHLNPLTRQDAAAILSHALGDEIAAQTLNHLELRGLQGLWSNPQTLELVERVAKAGALPNTKGELFASATALLGGELSKMKVGTSLANMPIANVLDAAGAAFAALILAGKEAISRQIETDDDDLALREIVNLPDANRLTEILGARLFSARGVDRFSYAHRAIGEFLGARWLARNANTPRKRRRLQALFNGNLAVPASLRGIHAWIAWHAPDLAQWVIQSDPMGLVEYGDADCLTVQDGRALFKALELLSQQDPRFRDWSEYRVAGLIQRPLMPEIERILTEPGIEFGLRWLVLQALEGSPLVSELTDILLSLVRDPEAGYTNRYEAGSRLIELGFDPDWPAVARELLTQQDEDAVRLAAQFADQLNYTPFDDNLLTDIVAAQLRLTDRTVGVYHSLEHKLPQSRIEPVLDGVVATVAAMKDPREISRRAQITDLAYGLIARRLEVGPIDPARLWSWLEPFRSQVGLHRASRDVVARRLAADETLRRSVQRHALFEAPGDRGVWERSWRLSERTTGLALTEADVAFHLETLASEDPRWRDLVQTVPHSTERGEIARKVAARFVADDPEAQAWLTALSSPRVPIWEIEEKRRRRWAEAARLRRWRDHRANFLTHIESMRAGDYRYIVNPAKAYLKLFDDMGEEAADGPARLEEWLGPELCEASLLGFEAFLATDQSDPNAKQIADSHAEGRYWEAANIIVAALAERHRTEKGFEDVSDNRLMAGLFEVRRTRVDDHAGIPELEAALADEVRRRGAWEQAQRLYIEPQLRHLSAHVDGLYALLRAPEDAALATSLAAEWLAQFPLMPLAPEAELMDCLMASAAGQGALRDLLSNRLADTSLAGDRLRNWQAVGIILNFEPMRQSLEARGEIEADLFWQVRLRLPPQRQTGGTGSLSVAQLVWLIETFRPLHEWRERPGGVTSGDANPWDATNFLISLINRLADDATDDAITALNRLREVTTDGYTEVIRTAAASQRRKRIEIDWTSPDLKTIASVVTDAAPTTAAQLQVVILEELRVVQAKLRGSDVDWYRDFFDGARPRVEEACRDTILKMVTPLPFGVLALPEGHLADDKRCDIICLLGNLMVPIEIKGQWHPDVWTAADLQLDRLYQNDWRAERGVYLILWFGRGSLKPPCSTPPGIPPPQDAAELQAALTRRSPAALDGRVEVVVLDLTRPI